MLNKKIIIILSLIIITAGTIFYFKKNNKNEVPLFKTKTCKIKNLTQYVNSSGTLKAKEQITVGSLVAGRVIKIIADNNDVVKKNQILTILDDGIGDSAVKQLTAALQEARAKLVYQEKFFARQKALYQTEQISKNSFEQYTKDLEVAKSIVNQTEAQLEIRIKDYENLFIRSPDNGTIIAKEVDLGQMVTSRLQATVLYAIAKDLKEMEAQVDVDEADVGMVQEGQEAVFTVDAFPKLKFEAKVKQIRYLAKIVDNVVTYATILDIDNADLKLRPGMTTDVYIKVAEAKDALVILNKILRINSNHLELVAKKLGYEFERIPGTDDKTEIENVWTLVDGNKFKQVAIKLGAKEGKYTQVLSGLDKNTILISEATELKRENLLLKQMFSQKAGGIGKK